MLLQELERPAAEAGATEIVLDTHHTLEAAAGLYTRSGDSEIEPYNDNDNDNADAAAWLGKALPTS